MTTLEEHVGQSEATRRALLDRWWRAAAEGDVDQVADLLWLVVQGGHWPDGIDVADTQKQSALMIAAAKGRSDVVKLLLLKGARVDKEDNDGRTALQLACAMGRAECVQVLLDHGATVDTADDTGSTAVLKAARQGHFACLQLLLDKGADPNRAFHGGGAERLTPLHVAVQNNHIRCVQLLLERGARINAATKQGITALRIAFKDGRLECVKLLMGKGARIKPENKQDELPILVAAGTRHVECLEWLLQNGADVNGVQEDGSTALFAAASKGNLECIRILIKNGANVSHKRNDGQTPLHLVPNVATAVLLIENGASVNECDNNGRSPLHLAVSSHRRFVWTYLLQHGTTVATVDKQILSSSGFRNNNRLYEYLNDTLDDKQTLLHVVCAQEFRDDLLDLLLIHGANPNITSSMGLSPLMYAVLFVNVRCAKLLIAKGADVNHRDKLGRCVFHAFTAPIGVQSDARDYVDFIGYLAGIGSDPTVKDNKGESPRDLALRMDADPVITAALAKAMDEWDETGP